MLISFRLKSERILLSMYLCYHADMGLDISKTFYVYTRKSENSKVILLEVFRNHLHHSFKIIWCKFLHVSLFHHKHKFLSGL